MFQTNPAPSLTSFDVVFTYQDTAKVILLDSVHDANCASVALNAARSRLIQAQVRGELELVRHNGETHTLLRESLDSTDL
jgi:hypothetical protein